MKKTLQRSCVTYTFFSLVFWAKEKISFNFVHRGLTLAVSLRLRLKVENTSNCFRISVTVKIHGVQKTCPTPICMPYNSRCDWDVLILNVQATSPNYSRNILKVWSKNFNYNSSVGYLSIRRANWTGTLFILDTMYLNSPYFRRE